VLLLLQLSGLYKRLLLLLLLGRRSLGDRTNRGRLLTLSRLVHLLLHLLLLLLLLYSSWLHLLLL
jgi:hypothetical protein